MKRALRTILVSAAVAAVPAGMIVVAGAGPALAATTYPSQYAAPYLQIDSGDAADMSADMKASGDAYYTLAFLIPKSGCTPEWEDGGDAMNAFTSQVKSLQAAGGNVIISSGGESGGELAQTCTSVSSLEAEYASIVSTYGVTRLDFDIEGSTLDDTASNARRDQALAELQAANPAVTVDFTLPVDPTGMESDATALLKDAESKGVKVNLVNIMTMDFGDGQNALKDAESAAPASEAQINGIFGGTAAQSWHMLGLTPIAGQNDDNEDFTEANAVTLETFAAGNGVQELSFWEVDGYDKATGYTYSKDFNKITTTSTPPSNNFSLAVSPASGSVTGSAGGSLTATVSTAVASGSAESVALSAAGGPAGSTVTFSPTSVTSGNSSTLTISLPAGTTAGTYPITVSGTDGTNTHTATYTLTVTGTGASTVYQAESPTNTLAGGAIVISCSTCSGGARVGYIGSGGTLTMNGVNVATAGTYNIVIAYTQAESSKLTADISVNGAKAKAFSFAKTASFTTPANLTVSLTLAAGNNTIEFSNPSADAPDIDAITVPGSPS
jgi:chitinase